MTAFLGRAQVGDQIRLRTQIPCYRNGYGRARRLTLSPGTIQRRPGRENVRGTEEQFESRLLPLFVNRTRKVAELIPDSVPARSIRRRLRAGLCGGCWERTHRYPSSNGGPVEVQVERPAASPMAQPAPR